jgi:hypothetical protein
MKGKVARGVKWLATGCWSCITGGDRVVFFVTVSSPLQRDFIKIEGILLKNIFIGLHNYIYLKQCLKAVQILVT